MKQLIVLILACAPAVVWGQKKWVSPAVPDFGDIRNLTETKQPDPGIDYKVVLDISIASDNPKRTNPGLYHLARFMNLHAAGGIPPEKMHIVAVIHGGTTFSVLDDKGYNKHNGTDNPNIKLISQLKEAGVQFYVCGQSLMARNNGFDNVNPEVDISLSAMTVVTEFQSKGYGVMKFD